MRLRDVQLDVALLLEAAGLGSTTSAPPTLYVGRFPPSSPDAMACCRLASGEEPERYLGGMGVADHHVVVTVLVRGARGPQGFTESQARAQAAYELLFDTCPPGYQWVRVEDSAGPLDQGEDENGRPQWSFSVECFYTSAP